MNNTLTELQTMRTGSLKGVLQDLYATGNTESAGNTDTTTNGSDAYDSHVSIVYCDDHKGKGVMLMKIQQGINKLNI